MNDHHHESVHVGAPLGAVGSTTASSRATALAGLGYGQQRAMLAPPPLQPFPQRTPRPVSLATTPSAGAPAQSLELGPAVTWLEAFISAVAHGGHGLRGLEVPLARVARAVTARSIALRDGIMSLLNASSVSRQGRAPDPVLPTRAELHGWLTAAETLARLGRDPTSPVAGVSASLDRAARLAADAALAGFQGLSVLAARRSWRTGTEESPASDVARRGRDRTEVDAIFADAGFARRQVADGATSVHDWCGLFASAALFRGGGLDEELRAGLYHTSNVSDFFHYSHRANARRTPRSIWADGQWWRLRAYHERRGSLRSWLGRSELTRSLGEGSGPDLRPGDVLLINHSGGPAPDHIVIVDGWDAETRTVTTLEGNTIGVKAAGEGAERTESGELAAGAYGRSGVGMHVRRLDAPSRPRAGRRSRDAYRERPSATLFGRGRQSAVDFEEHTFASRAVPEALRFTPPEALSRQEQGRVGLRAPK